MNLDNISRVARRYIGPVAVSAAMVLGLASCTLDYYVGWVYMATAKQNPGVIDQYGIDFQTGALITNGTPVAAGNDPVALIPATNGQFIYVANKLDSTVQEFAVQADGTLASKNVYHTIGNQPVAFAMDPQGKFLYVAVTYQTGTSGPGDVNIFPVNSDNSLGTPTAVNVGNNPVGLVASYFNHFIYVLDQETAPNAAILGFSQNPTTGALTPVAGTNITTVAGKTVATGYAAGVVPSAIAEEPTSRFVYVTDQIANQLIGYTVQPNGALVPMVNGPFATGLFPVSLTIDPTGTLIYVANYNANTVQGYVIDLATGTPSGAVGAFATGVGAGPTCVNIDPALGNFLYTSNALDNTVTAERVTVNTGSLTGVQNSPFPASGTPTCLTSVPNGNHATQVITP